MYHNPSIDEDYSIVLFFQALIGFFLGSFFLAIFLYKGKKYKDDFKEREKNIQKEVKRCLSVVSSSLEYMEAKSKEFSDQVKSGIPKEYETLARSIASDAAREVAEHTLKSDLLLKRNIKNILNAAVEGTAREYLNEEFYGKGEIANYRDIIQKIQELEEDSDLLRDMVLVLKQAIDDFEKQNNRKKSD